MWLTPSSFVPFSPSAAPHSLVPTDQFYKHIDNNEPDAIRMRHLLVFVGKRVTNALAPASGTSASADVKGKGRAKSTKSTRTQRGEIIAGEVMEDVLRMLMRARVDTNPSSSGTQVRLPSRPPTADRSVS